MLHTVSSEQKRRVLGPDIEKQIKLLDCSDHIPRFEEQLKKNGLFPLIPTKLDILQINMGYLCNQSCSHCHIDAGPERKELMSRKVMLDCLRAIESSAISTVDLTGGAPEMHPDFLWFIEKLSAYHVEIILRSNLTILVSNKKFKAYPGFLAKNKVTIIASLPCYTMENTDRQRGRGVFDRSIEALRLLNRLGYGKKAALRLHLVYNPITASLPPAQKSLEADYKAVLKEKYDIDFNHLYTLTNLPVSRFMDQLLQNGRYESYLSLLHASFNSEAAKGVMCRNTISVRWDGKMFDCDFNQMLHLHMDKHVPRNISAFDYDQLNKRKISLNRHCYGCTAGFGSSCQGCIVH